MTDRIRLDDLAEDTFGLNLRGLKSMATIWLAPRRYFSAAETPDWGGRYTPSIRLWLSLIALASLLQFVWIGSNTPLVDAYAEGFRNAGVVPGEGQRYQELGEAAALWIYAIAPAMQLAGFLLLLPLFGFWGQPTTYSQRVRNSFAVMIPSATVLVAGLPALSLLSSSQLGNVGYLIGLVTLLLDAATGFRGTFQTCTRLGRMWRAGLLAAFILVLNIIINILAQIAGIIWVSVRFGVSAG
ncbi:hypothetical protein [Maricaulis sp.]|uniref:hypothetical protein n=1 Tax=Maricaulis sp. TaxID=1486257 RepID=UPI002634AA21|nr:hypothetical protein [Maricaulis sp.]